MQARLLELESQVRSALFLPSGRKDSCHGDGYGRVVAMQVEHLTHGRRMLEAHLRHEREQVRPPAFSSFTLHMTAA